MAGWWWYPVTSNRGRRSAHRVTSNRGRRSAHRVTSNRGRRSAHRVTSNRGRRSAKHEAHRVTLLMGYAILETSYILVN